MNPSQPHLQPDHLYTTIEAATMLGIAAATLRSHKSRHKGTLVEGTHWRRQSGGTVWTIDGLRTIAERTSTPEAKAVLSQIVNPSHSPLTLVVDTANPIEVIDTQPTSGLSDEEAQVFVETVAGKLPDPQVQDLLQQMQHLPTPERSQLGTETPPLQPCNVKKRVFLAASGVVAVLMLSGFGVWVSRMNATSAATRSDPSDRAGSQQTPSVVVSDRFATQRDRAIARSLMLATQQQDAIDIVRRDYLLAQAERDRKTTGISIEQWLTRHLNKQVEALQRSAKSNSGSAQQIAIARSITGETKATLLALQTRKTPSKSYSFTAMMLKRSLQQIKP